jgi:hypothetical protein
VHCVYIDNRGNQYFGPATAIGAGGTNITTFGRGVGGGEGNGYDVTGGACIIVNGSGAGQYRRILSYSMPSDGSGPGWFLLDSAFDTPPTLASGDGDGSLATLGAPSFLSCVPFRGRMIFYRNHFKDTGAFNFYGISIDNIVAENIAERFQGFEAPTPRPMNFAALSLPLPLALFVCARACVSQSLAYTYVLRSRCGASGGWAARQ